MNSSTSLATEQGTLATLVEQINEQHRRCEAAARTMLRHARRCGEYLLEAKGLAEHGNWEGWVKVNCTVSPRQARNYMTLAKNWDKLAELTKRKRVSEMGLEDLSIRAALRLIASDTDDCVYGSQFCPTCGERMVVTSRFYETCAMCWDCKLHPLPNAIVPRDFAKMVSSASEVTRHFGRVRDTSQRAEALISILHSLRDEEVVEISRLLREGRSQRRKNAAAVLGQLRGERAGTTA